MTQVLLNLLVNARHAMPDGGQVTITTELLRSTTGQDDGDKQVRLSVADTGVGMDAAMPQRIRVCLPRGAESRSSSRVISGPMIWRVAHR